MAAIYQAKQTQMVFHKHMPAAPLSHYVDCIVYVEGNNKGAGFPKTAMSLVFNLLDSFKLYTDKAFTRFTDYKKYWIAGLQTQPSYVESYGQSSMLVVQFTTTGAYAILQQPLHYFTNSYIHLDDVFGKEADETWEQLQAASNIREQFARVEHFLYRKLLKATVPNAKLLSAIDVLCKQPTTVSIKALCQQHNISRKHLNHLLKEYVGVSPKLLSSLHRFQRILYHISAARPDKLSSVAYELDFFDQAHFNNNFKKFTALKPHDYIRQVQQQPSLKLIPHFLPSG